MRLKQNIYFITVALLVTLSGYAQKNHSKQFKETLNEADILFDADDFKNAEQKYLSIYKEDSTNEQLNLNIAIRKYKLKEFPDSILPYLIKVDKSKNAESFLR